MLPGRKAVSPHVRTPAALFWRGLLAGRNAAPLILLGFVWRLNILALRCQLPDFCPVWGCWPRPGRCPISQANAPWRPCPLAYCREEMLV